MTTKAGVLTRVSTDHQTASNQIPDIDRFTAHHAYDVTATYEISESAWNGGKDNGEYRKTIQQILDDAWAGKFSVLIVWALDRITREGAEGALRIIRQLRERGCILVSIKESWLNGSPEIQDVLVAFAGWQAQQESQRRSDRIRAGLARRKAEGKPVGGRPAGAKDKRKRQAATGQAAGWTEERRQALRARNRQRAPRLSAEQVAEARAMYGTIGPDGKPWTVRRLADRYGAAYETIRKYLAADDAGA